MLDIALLNILSQDIELIALIEILFLLRILPKRVRPIPRRLDAKIPKQIGQKALPYPLYLLDLPIDKINQLIRRLLQPPKQMPQTIIHRLIDQLPTNHIDTHAPQGILGVEIKRQILAYRIDLIGRKRKDRVVSHRIRSILDILQLFIHLYIHHYTYRFVLGLKQKREVAVNLRVAL